MPAEDVVEQVTEHVAENLEVAAAVTRRINPGNIGYLAGGLIVGVAVGFFIGHRYNKARIRAEAFKESEAEVEKIRETYRQKTVAAKPKPTAEEIIEDRGYAAVEVVEEPPRPLKPVVPVNPPRAKRTEEGEKDKNTGWHYPHEMMTRTSDHPYIIHQDEFHVNESGFQQVSYNYYMGDEVLAEEDDTVCENIDRLVGEGNLGRFGHGTDDINLLYIRNPVLELEFEISRIASSYAEMVLGLDGHDRSEDETT